MTIHCCFIVETMNAFQWLVTSPAFGSTYCLFLRVRKNKKKPFPTEWEILFGIFERDLSPSGLLVRTTFQWASDFDAHATTHHLYSVGVCICCNVCRTENSSHTPWMFCLCAGPHTHLVVPFSLNHFNIVWFISFFFFYWYSACMLIFVTWKSG